MMAITPSRPRQRVSPSPTGKASLIANVDITVSRANGASRYVDRKEQQQYSYSVSSQLPIESYSPKHPLPSRNQCCLHWVTCYKHHMVVFMMVIVLFTVALSVFIRTAPNLINISNVSLEVPSRSLLLKIHDKNAPETTDTGTLDPLHVSDNPHPNIVWLMSFPNSGTSFIIHMTREATNCTTATNYGLEGEIRDKPSIQAIQGPLGVNGPWLELLPSKKTRIAETILTKTHCKGFCSGSFCGADRTFHTTRSFMIGCLTGNQGVLSSKGLRLTDKTYDKSLVKKAIHLFRHPLDNIVARFHLEYNEKSDAGNTKYVQSFPKNALGFRRWCYLDDQNRGLVRSRFVDQRLRDFMLKIPCFNEFYRYTQWHNLAFEAIRMMNVSSMVLHYHEFSDNFTKARNSVINFLDLPLVGEGINFDDGKVYSHYYTNSERSAIRMFLEEFASTETWEQLQRYSFGNEKAIALDTA